MKPTILVIEDDPVSAHLVGLVLGPEQYDTIVASNGLEGLKMARNEAPDLIVLDLMLPGQDGFEVLRRLRAEPHGADLPVVVVSAKAQATDRETAARLGANAYLTKPFDRAELRSHVRSLVGERREKEAAEGTCVVTVGARGEEASSIVVYVGVSLARQDQTTTIVDFRPFSVEHSLLLDLSPRSDPLPLSDPETLRSLPSLTERESSGLRLLNNLEGSGKAGQLTADDARRVLDALLTEPGFVLAEAPLYPTDLLRQIAACSALVLLVTARDRASLAAARSALSLMEQAGIKAERTGVVLAGAAGEGGRPQLDPEVIGTVPAKADAGDPAFRALADRLLSLEPSPSEESASDAS